MTLSLTGTVEKQYDGTNTAALGTNNFTLSNVVAGDSGLLSVTNLPTSGAYDNANAGSGKTVSVQSRFRRPRRQRGRQLHAGRQRTAAILAVSPRQR